MVTFWGEINYVSPETTEQVSSPDHVEIVSVGDASGIGLVLPDFRLFRHSLHVSIPQPNFDQHSSNPGDHAQETYLQDPVMQEEDDSMFFSPEVLPEDTFVPKAR